MDVEGAGDSKVEKKKRDHVLVKKKNNNSRKVQRYLERQAQGCKKEKKSKASESRKHEFVTVDTDSLCVWGRGGGNRLLLVLF